MLRHLPHLNALHCDRCKEDVEISRSVLSDPVRYVALLERTERRHKICRPHVPETRLWVAPGKDEAWQQLARRINEVRAA